MKIILILFLVLSTTSADAQCDSLNSFEKTMALISKLKPDFHYLYDSSDHVYKFDKGVIYHPLISDGKKGLILDYYFKEDYNDMINKLNSFLSECSGKKTELSEKPTLYKNTIIHLFRDRKQSIGIFFNNLEE